MMMRRLAALALPVLVVTGCAGGGDEPAATTPPPAAAASSSTSTSAAPEPTPAAMDAAAVQAALAEHVATLKPVRTYTAEDDPNGLLGRPNGYESKTAFADTRVPADKTEGLDPDAVERGGSVEVYPDDAGAKARSEYIQTILKEGGGMFGTEYHYLSGPVLVRVTGNLTPAQAGEYETALTTALG